MQLVIAADGSVRCVYSEEIDIHVLGKAVLSRGSHVEPDENGRWSADLSPVNGPTLGPFDRRSQALEAEVEWLETNRLALGAV